MEGHAWAICVSQVLSDGAFKVGHVLGIILILGLVHFEVDFEVVSCVEIGEIIAHRDVVVDLVAHHESCFICPAARHILNGVPASAKQH